MTLQCPICHVAFVHAVLEDYEVEVRRESKTQVGGLEVLTCCNGHIFFVRKSDISTEMVSGAAA
jgi:hypothetical protein